MTLQKISDTIIHTWIGSDPVILYYLAVSATISHKTAGIAASIFLSMIGQWPGNAVPGGIFTPLKKDAVKTIF